MKRRIPFHPALLSVFPILSFWLANKDFVPFHSTWRTLSLRATRRLLLYKFSSRQPEILEREAR